MGAHISHPCRAHPQPLSTPQLPLAVPIAKQQCTPPVSLLLHSICHGRSDGFVTCVEVMEAADSRGRIVATNLFEKQAGPLLLLLLLLLLPVLLQLLKAPPGTVAGATWKGSKTTNQNWCPACLLSLPDCGPGLPHAIHLLAVSALLWSSDATCSPKVVLGCRTPAHCQRVRLHSSLPGSAAEWQVEDHAPPWLALPAPVVKQKCGLVREEAARQSCLMQELVALADCRSGAFCRWQLLLVVQRW